MKRILQYTSDSGEKMMGTVVLLSGGLDSAAAAAFARRFFGDPTIGLYVNYHSVHREREYRSARKVAKALDIPLYTAEVSYPDAVDSPLLARSGALTRIATGNLCIVPMRNAILLSLGAALAYSLKATFLVYGAHTADEFGYPDCRRQFVEAMQETVLQSLDQPVQLSAPLLFPEETVEFLQDNGYDIRFFRSLLDRKDIRVDVKGKAFSLLMLDALGFSELIPLTHSCYAGVGGGCGECATCRLRNEAAKVYAEIKG